MRKVLIHRGMEQDSCFVLHERSWHKSGVIGVNARISYLCTTTQPTTVPSDHKFRSVYIII